MLLNTFIIFVTALSFIPSRAFLAPSIPRFAATMSALSQDELKKMVGYKAVDDYVRSGMVSN